MTASNAIRVVRKEESLRSVQKEGTHIRLLYENELLELLTTEVGPGNVVESEEFWNSKAVHFVIEGGFLFHDSNTSVFLLPGDTIAVRRGKEYSISNATACRAVLWSLLFKKAKATRNGGGL